jgi:hypothetical protein
MSEIKRSIEGQEFVHCNCDYGCQCQFNGRPTQGKCHAVLAVDIERGRHRTTKLDGLKRLRPGREPFTKAKAKSSRSSTSGPRQSSVRLCCAL